MIEAIEQLAELLNVPAHGTLKLARDVADNPYLPCLCDLRDDQTLELYLFLYDVAMVEGKIRLQMRA